MTSEDKKATSPERTTPEDKKEENEYRTFLETCLGGSVEDTDAHDTKVLGIKDIFGEIEETKEDTEKEKKPAECFALDDSDNDDSSFGDDDDDEEWDLEDAYNFDPEKVAELLKKSGPIDEEEVIETIQESLADAMLLRMNLENPEEEAARPDCSGQLDGRMTPPAKAADFDVATPPDPKVLAEKLENTAGRRRSSIGGRQNINDAVRSGAARTRKSIACIASHKTADVEDKAKILMAADKTTKRHRMSLCKAAETLDMAGLGDEDPEELKEKLKTISKCVMVARGRHRMIVASAVNKTVIGEEEEDSFKDITEEAKSSKEESSSSAGPKATPKPKFMSKLRACAKEYVPTAKQQSIKEKIEAAVAAAYKRNGPVKVPEKSEVKEEWTTAYEDMSCYGYEGYTWDGYGGGYDWNNAYACDQMGNMGNQMAYNQTNCNQMGNQMAYNQMAYDQTGYNQVACGQMGCGQMGCGQMGCGQMGCGQMGCGQMGAQGCNQPWQGQWEGQAAQGWNGNYGYDNTGGNYGAAYGNDYNNCYYNNYGQAQNGYGGGNWQNAAWGSA